MEVTIEGKTILTKIMEKKEAEQRYDDAIASGNTAVKMKEDEATPDVLCLNIGRLKTKTEAVVKVKIITLL